MNLGLQGKVIIVTGGGSGIGASVVEKLSLIGATPVILDKSKPDTTSYENIKQSWLLRGSLKSTIQQV